MQTKLAGENTVMASNIINNLGTLLRDQKKLPEAQALFRQSLEIRKKIQGPKHPAVAKADHNLAGALRDEGKLDDAVQLQQQAVAIALEGLGPEHPDLAMYRSQLGSILTQLKRYDEAEQSLFAAYQVLEPQLAKGSRDSLLCARRLADLYDAWGKPEQAATYRALVPATRSASTQAAGTTVH
jgi:tetratricopeptide (TPR) repeat protein